MHIRLKHLPRLKPDDTMTADGTTTCAKQMPNRAS